MNTSLSPTIENLSQAIYTVNRHAKTAPNPSYLYALKKMALDKLLLEGKATKLGLHYSRNPKRAQQSSDVLIQCGDYLFHTPPKKDDFKTLPHLGKLDHSFRNPKARLSLNHAKSLLASYTGLNENDSIPGNRKRKEFTKPVFKRLGEQY